MTRRRRSEGPGAPAERGADAEVAPRAPEEEDRVPEPIRPEEVQVPEESRAPEEPQAPEEPEVPAEPPPRERGGEAAIPDRPLGVQSDEDSDEEESPGFLREEPPASG